MRFQREPSKVEWLGDAFVVFRWTMLGDVGKATSEMVLVLGRSDSNTFGVRRFVRFSPLSRFPRQHLGVCGTVGFAYSCLLRSRTA